MKKLEKVEIDGKENIEIGFMKIRINEAVEEYNNLPKVTQERFNYYQGYIHGLKTGIRIIENSNK